jgi:hypothetical protein
VTGDVRQTAQGWREGPREVVQCCGVTTNTLDHDACGRWEPHGGNLGSPTTATLTAGGKFSVAMPLNAGFKYAPKPDACMNALP